MRDFVHQVAKDFAAWIIIGICGFVANKISNLSDSVTDLNKNMAVMVQQMLTVNEQTKQNTADIVELKVGCAHCKSRTRRD